MWIYTGNKLAKFHGNILSLSENIARSFRGLLFWLTLYTRQPNVHKRTRVSRYCYLYYIARVLFDGICQFICLFMVRCSFFSYGCAHDVRQWIVVLQHCLSVCKHSPSSAAHATKFSATVVVFVVAVALSLSSMCVFTYTCIFLAINEFYINLCRLFCQFVVASRATNI